MATPKSKPRSRKRRRHHRPASAAAPPVLLETREESPDRTRVGSRRASPLGAYGERPPSPFGRLPVSEIAIFAGVVALVFGVIGHGGRP